MVEYEERDVELGLKRLVLIARKCAQLDSIERVNMPWNVCIMCGYRWGSGSGTMPDKCPSCKSTRWGDNDLHKHRCMACGHCWVSRSDKPLRCPKCRTKSWATHTRSEVGKCRFPLSVIDSLKRIEDESACITHLMDVEGLDCSDAQILYLDNRGLNTIRIAREVGVPYDRVFDTVAEFRSLSLPAKRISGGMSA